MADLTKSQRTALLRRAHEDPAWWVRETFGEDPWHGSVRVLESVRDNRQTAVRSCHAAAKSYTAARAALWFLVTHPRSIVITTAPSDRQVRGILWKEIGIAHRRASTKGRAIGGELLTQNLVLDRDWFAKGFTARTPDHFQGWHADGGVLVVADESSGIQRDIFDEGIHALMTGENTKLLMIGNPTDPNSEFAKAFRNPDVSKIKISAFDTPNFREFGITPEDIQFDTWRDKIRGRPLPRPYLVTPQWVAERHRAWGPRSPMYTSRVMADFPEADPFTLIPLSWIERAQSGDLPPRLDDLKRLGVDPARFGDDETVLALKHGRRYRVIETARQLDTMETVGLVQKQIATNQPHEINVDEIGVGAGVVDRLRETGVDAKGVSVGSSASDPDAYLNLRAQAYWELRGKFESGEIDLDPYDEELASQLNSIRYKYRSDKKIQIESKEDMKKRGLSSPDRADAIMLADLEVDELEGVVLW